MIGTPSDKVAETTQGVYLAVLGLTVALTRARKHTPTPGSNPDLPLLLATICTFTVIWLSSCFGVPQAASGPWAATPLTGCSRGPACQSVITGLLCSPPVCGAISEQ